ncbi:MAG: MurR/RpiR family transcriptional regulator, partial [Streptococcaceae bacterium]|nr:MurR/RpiR family transcriptional regulator [Streptococcaceae bacterium]
MNIIFQRIELVYERLTKSEKKLADYIREYPRKVIKLNTIELAEAANVSRPTISRMLERINVEGIGALHFGLEMAFATQTEKIPPVQTEIQRKDSVETVAHKLSTRYQMALEESTIQLDFDLIEDILDLIEKAEDIFVFGMAPGSSIARNFYHRFQFSEKKVFHDQSHLNIATAISSSADPNALIFLISNSGEVYEINMLAKMAKQQGIRVIGISSQEKSQLVKYADDMIVVHTLDYKFPLNTTTADSAMSMLLVVDIIFQGYAARHYDDTF